MSAVEENQAELMRLADASLNRLAEGLRFLEDVCRFVLNDKTLGQRLKNLRHLVTVSGWEKQKELVFAGNATGDVGANLEAATGNEIPRDLLTSVVSNSRRAQEALRSLEEVAKIMVLHPGLSAVKLQQTRFEMYTIEKEILSKLTRQEKVRQICGLYVVIDTAALHGRKHCEVAAQVIRGGARVIQLRDKTMDRGLLLPIARDLKSLCAQNNVPFIINDYLDLALAVKADGVHLGQTDLPVAVARQLAPVDFLIGCSVTGVPQAKQAQADGADYLAVSGVYPTASKEAVKPLGVVMVKHIATVSDLPLVAIGGIKLEYCLELRKAGADAIAVISAVLGARSPAAAARQFAKKFNEKNNKNNR